MALKRQNCKTLIKTCQTKADKNLVTMITSPNLRFYEKNPGEVEKNDVGIVYQVIDVLGIPVIFMWLAILHDKASTRIGVLVLMIFFGFLFFFRTCLQRLQFIGGSLFGQHKQKRKQCGKKLDKKKIISNQF